MTAGIISQIHTITQINTATHTDLLMPGPAALCCCASSACLAPELQAGCLRLSLLPRILVCNCLVLLSRLCSCSACGCKRRSRSLIHCGCASISPMWTQADSMVLAWVALKPARSVGAGKGRKGQAGSVHLGQADASALR